MKKLFLSLACTLLTCLALAACGGNAYAATDEFVSANALYSVTGVQMVTVTPTGFTLQYADGNSSDLFPDVGGVQFTKLKNFAPAFKDMVQVGSSGLYINPGAAKKIICQYGTGTPGTASATGDHVFVIWSHNNWNLFDDNGCTSYNAIKASAN